ncbi:MAG: hypothetical protein ACP5H8_02845 [Candidatus Micrarchaeia archaeon]
MGKGFVFTIDVLISLLFASSFAAILYSEAARGMDTSAYNDAALYEYSTDLMIMLAKGGYLYKLADKDFKDVQELFSLTPQQYCFYIRISDKDGKKVITLKKYGCASAKNINTYVRSMFVKDGKPYLAELGAWYKIREGS